MIKVMIVMIIIMIAIRIIIMMMVAVMIMIIKLKIRAMAMMMMLIAAMIIKIIMHNTAQITAIINDNKKTTEIRNEPSKNRKSNYIRNNHKAH